MIKCDCLSRNLITIDLCIWTCTVLCLVFSGNSNPTRVHYGDVIMGAIASQITSLTIVYSTVYSDADQSKHQSSASLAFVRGIHRGPVNSPHKWPVPRKMCPFDDVIVCFFHALARICVVVAQTVIHSIVVPTAILHETFSNAFCWMKSITFWLKFHYRVNRQWMDINLTDDLGPIEPLSEPVTAEFTDASRSSDWVW